MTFKKLKTFKVAVDIGELGERTHIALEKMLTQKRHQNTISLDNWLITESLFLQEASLQSLTEVAFFFKSPI